jgi:hypothetical protein
MRLSLLGWLKNPNDKFPLNSVLNSAAKKIYNQAQRTEETEGRETGSQNVQSGLRRSVRHPKLEREKTFIFKVWYAFSQFLSQFMRLFLRLFAV